MNFIIKHGSVWNGGKQRHAGEAIDLDPDKDAALIAEGNVATAEQLKEEADAKAEEAAHAKKKADAIAKLEAERVADLKAKADAKKKGGAK